MRILYFIITSSLMIGLMLLFRRLFRKKLSANVIYGLWFIVFLRLLIPFGYWDVPVIGIAAEYIYRPMTIVEQLLKENEKEKTPVSEEIHKTETPVIETQPSSESIKIYDAVIPESDVPNQEIAFEADNSVLDITKESWVTPKTIILSIWFAGSLVAAGYVILQNRKLRKQVDTMEVIDQRDGIDICVSKDIKTPCLFGLRNPKIIVTEDVLADAMLYEYAITHELEHYRHKDHIYNADRIFMCILYWWNPIVWYAAKCVSEDAELACDERVLKNKTAEERKNYGYALLQMMENAQSSPFCMATSYFGGKHTTKQRIESIARNTKTRKYVLIPVIALLVILNIAGCVYPSEKSYLKTTDWKDGDIKGWIITETEFPYSVQENFKSYVLYCEVYEYGELVKTEVLGAAKLDGLTGNIKLRHEFSKSDEPNKFILEIDNFGIEMQSILSNYPTEGGYAFTALQSNKKIEILPEKSMILGTDYRTKNSPIQTYDCLKLSHHTEDELKELFKNDYVVGLYRIVFSELESSELYEKYSRDEIVFDWSKLANEWAKAFVDKDVETITNLATENACQQLISSAILDEERTNFGWSSPWPVFTDEHYRVAYCDSKGAEILYYATDSTPHVYVWKEKLEFTTVQNETKVYSWSLERFEEITELDEFHEAYPRNQISNTPMDYYTNGLGEALNNNAMLSSSNTYQSLFDAGSAALELLNVSKDYSLVHYNTIENEYDVSVNIKFLNKDGSTSSTSITMWQPYGKEGIWIPAGEEMLSLDEYNEKYSKKEFKTEPEENNQTNASLIGNTTNASKIIKQADERLREGYKEVKLTYVDNAEVGWNYYNDNPWASVAERDALAQAALMELYTLTGYNVEECTYTTDGRSRFIFGKSASNIKKSIAFYSRDYGFTLCGDSTPYMGFVNARKVHYSDVQQLDSPYHKAELQGHGAIPTWFLEHSGIYQGEKITGFDAINLDDTVFTHIKLHFDGGYYIVVMDEKIESVADIMGPYYE